MLPFNDTLRFYIENLHQSSNIFFHFQTPQSTTNDENSALHDVKQVNPLCPKEGHVTVGESSGCEETSDKSCRDQPRASASGQENEYSTNKDTSYEGG